MCRDVHVTSNVELRNNVRNLLNVELRNYVISRQIVERQVTSDCYLNIVVIFGLLVNIPITICITVIPPLPSPPLPYLPPHPTPPSPPSLSSIPSLSPHTPSLPHVPSPPSLSTLPPSPPHPLSPILPSPPFPPSNKFIVLSSLSKALVIANGVDIIVLGTPFFNDIGADKLGFIWNWKQLALSADGLPETSSSDNIAVRELRPVIQLYACGVLCLGPQCTGTPHVSRSDWALHLALLDIIKDGLSKLDRFARTFRRTAEAFLCTKWHTTRCHASRGSTYCSTIEPARARTLTKPGRNSSQRRTMYS